MKIILLLREDEKYQDESFLPVYWFKYLKRMYKNLEITAVCMTMAQNISNNMIETLKPYGIDYFYLISDIKFAGADTLATAYTLSEAIRKFASDFNLIFTNFMSSFGETGNVPVEVAALLDIPFATNVDNFYIKDDEFFCSQNMGSYYEKIHVASKMVISFSNDPKINVSVNGMPNLYDINLYDLNIVYLDSRKLKINPQKCGIEGSVTSVKDMKQITSKVKERIQISEFNDNVIETVKRFLEKVNAI